LKIFKDVGNISLSNIATSGLGSFFWFYLANLMSAESYGEIQFYISIAGFAYGLSMLGQSNTIVVYEAKKVEIRKALFTVSILGGIFTSIVLFIIYQRIDVGLLTIGMIIVELVTSYFLGKQQFLKYSFLMILQKILMIIFGIWFYNIMGIEGVIIGIGVSYMIFTPIIYSSLKNNQTNFHLIRQNFGFIMNNYIILVVGTIKGNLDKILIMPVVGFGVLGNYGIAFQIYHMLMIFSNVALKYSLPQNSSGNSIRKFNVLTIIISIFLSLVGIFIIPKVIPIYFPNFMGSIEVVPFLSLAVIPNSLSLIFSSKYLGSEKSRFVLIANLSSTLIYLICLAILVSDYQLIGIGISYLIMSIINAIILILFYYNNKR